MTRVPAASSLQPVPGKPRPRVLSIAGSDPSGGAGIQADLKSIAANGGYGLAVITALTAQNTRGVTGVHVPPVEFLTRQLEAISADVTVDAVKIGMLGNAEVIGAVADWLGAHRPAVVVLDPVMVASSGDRLLDADAEAALGRLMALADVVTPNVPELAALLGEAVAADWESALEQGKRLAAEHGVSVLVKGGHLDGDISWDALVDLSGASASDVTVFEAPRVDTVNTHGTGCSLSSALATLLGAGLVPTEAVGAAKAWLLEAIATSSELAVGAGHGPVNHFHHGVLPSARDVAGYAADLWTTAAGDLERIYELPFIAALGDGSLEEADFAYYLAQDALYLNTYSRVLAAASSLAPTEAEQAFWAKGARECLDVEAELHRSWLVGREVSMVQGPETKQYVDHLLARAGEGDYAVLVAAILPCYWLYAEVGAVLFREFEQAGAPDSHQYAMWLRSYSDPAFAEATRQAIAYTAEAARRSTPAQWTAMQEAFAHSSRFEVDFFDAPSRRVPRGRA
ncbi:MULTISPECIES: bifunctional hydroxymethylpyrimidine kinase/phosphomethylpyrimidine kinase [Arthrobacter]|uniref:Bifunctional hydroxymethylpyrimidine kinase/phosphomethylpyrimidine kinase n=2 Tax=Arthrobacter TaxID=1663 RepID=A0ABU9KFU4_9MICC|nr:bifunctional hydroxymethylpyrimidine kinase/phosphomethylpyrimidine kinase [Arthrobacter sp. YJM1]MDP5225672.1 bifunctional hydroxymethylpyrimidine kinase/phosphomethylpyrimidine kinase [Arthrobacter sp. YJM1]